MSIVYFNGEYVPQDEALIPVEERGYNFGDSLYEVCRVYGGRPFTLDRHIARMMHGAQIINLNVPLGPAEFEEIVIRLARENGNLEGYTYIQVSRGNAPRAHAIPPEYEPNVVVIVKPFQAMTLQQRYAGVTAITHPDLRHGYCHVKSTNLLANVLPLQAARDSGHFEALLVRGNHITEGTNTSAWMIKDGVIHTYPMVNILPGITRSVIIDISRENDLCLREEPFTPDQLYRADEAFITGSTLEIMPVVEVDGRPIGSGKAGPVTRQLIDHYIEFVERECGQYWAE